MKSILYVGAEVMPFAATGGLGDVLGSLPAAVKRKDPDCDVRVVMPLYGQVKDEWRKQMKREIRFMVHLNWRSNVCVVYSLVKDGVTFYFLDNPYYFNRKALYGDFDDAERFAFFSVAVLEMMHFLDFYPEVLHANDWQTALAVIHLKGRCKDLPGYRDVRAVYTIHNIEYQGVYGMDMAYDTFDLRDADCSIVEYNGALNLTKGAIVCADHITTVSPNYAKEIQTETYSCGLHYILRDYKDKIHGIVNGIDLNYYDPANDPDIPNAYSLKDLAGKKKNKEELQKKFGLKVDPNVPVIAMISRLASHKGFNLVLAVFDEMMQHNVQFVLLGTGEKQYETFFSQVAKRYPGKVSINLVYNRELSKLIYAGSDIFLMPSKSEACGLSQMIASRYGSVPVVRETGGLFDTIKPYGVNRSGNGFTFAAYNAHDMLVAVREAESLYKDKEHWTALVKKVMGVDFSWDASADKYMDCYKKVLNFNKKS